MFLAEQEDPQHTSTNLFQMYTMFLAEQEDPQYTNA